MANEFVYAQPVKIWFGEGKFSQLSAILEELQIQRAVLVCGRHFAPEAQAMMEADKRFVALFSQVEQNPQLSGIEETVRLCRAQAAQAVIGIGGGSSMDTAKFAAAVLPCTLTPSPPSKVRKPGSSDLHQSWGPETGQHQSASHSRCARLCVCTKSLPACHLHSFCSFGFLLVTHS